MPNNRSNETCAAQNQRGITGLETAIIMVSFVIVASVFATTVLMTGVFSADQSDETIGGGLKKAASPTKLARGIIGIDSDGDRDLDRIQILIEGEKNASLLDLTQPIDDELVIDSFEYDGTRGKDGSIVRVNDSVYAVAYAGDNDRGQIVTIDIASNGQIANAVIDSYEFDSNQGKEVQLEHVAGDVYALAYAGNNDEGWVATVQISSAGTITKSIFDSLQFDSVKGKNPYLFKLTTGVWSIAYTDDNDAGWVISFALSNTGEIGASLIDSYRFDSVQGKDIDVLNTLGDIYAFAYSGDNDAGVIRTITIATDGTITKSVIDSWEFDAVQGKDPDIMAVSQEIYVMAYTADSGGQDVGHLTTVNISANGSITNSFVDSLEYQSERSKDPTLKMVTSGVFAVGYGGPDDDGFVSTFLVSTDGAISSAAIDTTEFDSVRGKKPVLMNDGNVFIVVYEGDNNVGTITTLQILATGEIGGDGKNDSNSEHSFTVGYIDRGTYIPDLVWRSNMVGGNNGDGFVDAGESADITIYLTALDSELVRNADFKLEIQSATHSVMTISRSTPAKIKIVNQLTH